VHGSVLGLQHLPRSDRWVNAARRDVVGRTNWRRDCAGVLDHGIGGRRGRDPNVLSRNLPGAIRWGYFLRLPRPILDVRCRVLAAFTDQLDPVIASA
jgi:hypothetical protein